MRRGRLVRRGGAARRPLGWGAARGGRLVELREGSAAWCPSPRPGLHCSGPGPRPGHPLPPSARFFPRLPNGTAPRPRPRGSAAAALRARLVTLPSGEAKVAVLGGAPSHKLKTRYLALKEAVPCWGDMGSGWLWPATRMRILLFLMHTNSMSNQSVETCTIGTCMVVGRLGNRDLAGCYTDKVVARKMCFALCLPAV